MKKMVCGSGNVLKIRHKNKKLIKCNQHNRLKKGE